MAAEEKQGGWWDKKLVDSFGPPANSEPALNMCYDSTAHAPYTKWPLVRAAAC